ncbi:MAG TPA: response regulator transcription factor [Rhizomicrobium sp.]|nr:response regulator transcription factor [Rhizomicrobium sp.]
MHALLIEDEPVVAQCIKRMLETEGFTVTTAELGEEGRRLASEGSFDIVVLDLQLPDVSGLNVLRSLRDVGVATPVLVLSGIAAQETKVDALRFGADDYLTKPFHRDELIARMRAVVRRARSHARSVITTGKIEVDLDAKMVSVDGAQIALTTKEYEVLELLSLRKGMTLTKEVILNQIYGGMDEPNEKIVDVFVCKLRKKLNLATNGRDYITTVWGRGYELRDPSAVQTAAA